MGEPVDVEFDRQRDRLIELGCPELAGRTPAEFAELVEPLREAAVAAATTAAADGDSAFVIVVSERLVPAERLVPLLRLPGGRKPGIVDRHHGEEGLAVYHPLPALGVPDTGAYLLTGFDRGDEFRGVPPEQAVPVITGRGRTPLTVPEGIAVVTQFPQTLVKNHCFMLAGSRRTGLPGDRRVPALWISERAPKLGWCWDGNPHDWLGVASCDGRRSARQDRTKAR